MEEIIIVQFEVMSANFEATSAPLPRPIGKDAVLLFPYEPTGENRKPICEEPSLCVRCVLNRLHWLDITFIYTFGTDLMNLNLIYSTAMTRQPPLSSK